METLYIFVISLFFHNFVSMCSTNILKNGNSTGDAKSTLPANGRLSLLFSECSLSPISAGLNVEVDVFAWKKDELGSKDFSSTLTELKPPNVDTEKSFLGNWIGRKDCLVSNELDVKSDESLNGNFGTSSLSRLLSNNSFWSFSDLNRFWRCRRGGCSRGSSLICWVSGWPPFSCQN